MSACQEGMEPFEGGWTLVDVWKASETSNNISSLGNIQYQYLPELYVNVYNHHLMVKSVLMLCVWKAAFPKSTHNLAIIVFAY